MPLHSSARSRNRSSSVTRGHVKQGPSPTL
jgi:hypothetical protein